MLIDNKSTDLLPCPVFSGFSASLNLIDHSYAHVYTDGRLHSVSRDLRSILTPLHCFLITGLPTPSSPTIEKQLVADVTEFTVPFAATRSSVDDEYRLRRDVP